MSIGALENIEKSTAISRIRIAAIRYILMELLFVVIRTFLYNDNYDNVQHLFLTFTSLCPAGGIWLDSIENVGHRVTQESDGCLGNFAAQQDWDDDECHSGDDEDGCGGECDDCGGDDGDWSDDDDDIGGEDDDCGGDDDWVGDDDDCSGDNDDCGGDDDDWGGDDDDCGGEDGDCGGDDDGWCGDDDDRSGDDDDWGGDDYGADNSCDSS